MDIPVGTGYDIEPGFLLINLCSPAVRSVWTRASPNPAGCVQTNIASSAESKVLPAVFTACLCPAVLGEEADLLCPIIRQYAGTILALSE